MSTTSIRVHGGAGPTLIYLPGIHGDYGIIGAFRRALGGEVRFVEIAYSKDEVSLSALTASVREALAGAGVTSGWLLPQSFGSQVAWELIEQGFEARGVILAGGFVKHPWPWAARFFRGLLRILPLPAIRRGYGAYTVMCNLLSRRGAAESAELLNFAKGRSAEQWRALAWRLRLIAESDPRPTARRTTVPVRYLGGALDPLVPWPSVMRWLKRECPGYAGGKILPLTEHNVLGSSPRRSAEVVLGWLTAA